MIRAERKIIGIRPSEKLHEQMIGEDDAAYTYEYDDLGLGVAIGIKKY